MKSKRIFFELFMLLVIAVLLVWKFWPVKNSVSSQGAAAAAPASSNTPLPVMSSTVAVEAPKVPPVAVAATPDNPSVPGNGSTLYDASKARAALTGSAGNGDDDYNTVVNGSPGLAKLHDILAQKDSLTQALTPIDNVTLPAPKIVVTDLGEIDLTQDQPILEKLVSGDQAVITLVSHPNAPRSNNGPVLTIQTKFLYRSGNEWIEYPGSESGLSILNAPSVKSGQEMTAKSIASGNEIHFVPVFASPAGTSP